MNPSALAGSISRSGCIRKDSVKVGTKQITRTEAITDDADITDVIIYLIKRAIKDNNATTAAKRKQAIEGLQVVT